MWWLSATRVCGVAWELDLGLNRGGVGAEHDARSRSGVRPEARGSGLLLSPAPEELTGRGECEANVPD
jgi:hypothetical protein